MYKIFTKVKQGNVFSEKVKHFLTVIEFSLIILIVDIILPIRHEYNYYFPLYFLNPILYLELGKIKNYTITNNDPNYINNTLRSVRESENILNYISKKYLTNTQSPTSFSYYQKDFLFLCYGLIITLLVGFLFLIFSNEKDSKSSEMKNKYNLYVNIIMILYNYIFLKPLVYFLLIILSNSLIPDLFFHKTGVFDVLNILNIFSQLVIICLAIFFIEYLWIAYSNKIGDQFSFSTYEKLKLLNKVLGCFLIQFNYFNSFHFDFLKIVMLVTIIYQAYEYYKNFIEGLKNNIIDFLFTNFIVAFLLVRSISFIGGIIYTNPVIQTRSFNILLLLFNFSIFSILTIKLQEIITRKIEINLFQQTQKIPLHLTLIMANYIENIFSTSNINVFMNNLDISSLVKKLKSHKTNCINSNNINCLFCKKFNFKKSNFDQKSILRMILEFLNNIDRKLLGREEKDYLVLTKAILIYIIDDFKIHRLSYFLIENLKQSTFKFSLILNFIYEKLIIRNMRDDDPNFILLNYVELNELFINAIKISLDFNEELKEKSKSIKKIISNNYKFGSTHKKIQLRLKSLQSNSKNIDKSNFYKYLWCYNLVYNVDFENDILLDLPENIELIDQSIFKFSFFLLNYHYDTKTWTFKKTPFIYMKNFGFTNKDMFGKSFDTIFPPLIKDFEKEKLDDLFKNSSLSRFTINTYLISKKSLIKNADLTFDILPALYENSFIISNIINYDLDKKDNVIMVNRNGIIHYTSEIPQTYLGISNKLIISHKDLVSMQTLFSIKDFRHLNEMPKNITIEMQNYYKNYTNSYIYEPTIKDNIEELDIKEFYTFYQKAKTFMNKNKIYVSLELQEERHNFFFYKCNIVDDQTDAERTKTKSIGLHLLNYFNIENEKEKSQNQTDDLGNFIKFEETYTMSAKNNSTSDSGREYFSAMNKNLKNQADQKVVEIISQIIWCYNVVIALLGLVFLLYIKIISSNVLNVYEVVKDLRIINSNYIDCMTHLVQLIVLDNSDEYDSLEKKAKLLDANINMNFSIYLHDEFKKLSDKVFAGRSKTYTDLLTYIDMDFLTNNLDTDTNNISLDGIMNSMPFLDLYQQFSNLAYQLSNIEDYYTNIPFIDIRSEETLLKAFKGSSEKERIILSLMYNYKFINEKFIRMDKVMSDYFDEIYFDFENKVYILFVIIIVVHLISIVLSFIELFIFQKKLLLVLKALLTIRKKELEYIHFKLKSAENLVDLENKPSVIIDDLKYQKHKIKRMLIDEGKFKAATGNYRNNPNNQASVMMIKDDNGVDNKKGEKSPDDLKSSMRTKNEREILLEKKERAGLDKIKSQNKRIAKSEIYLKKNRPFFNNHLYSIVKLLFYIICSYLLYSVIIFLIIENGFGNISISGEYIKEIVVLERLSVNYLVSLKLAIAFNDTITPMQTNEFIDDPKNLYISFNKIDNLITNYANMKVVKEYMNQLKDKNLCAVVLKNDLFITNTTIIDNICAFCNTNMIFSSNDKIIISFFIQNMRNLYVSFITSNKSEDSIGKIYNSELSQLINFIFLFFIRPFIRTTKDDLGFTIYLSDLNQMVYNSFILFGIISLIDIVNFLIMKRNIANKISDMFENLKKVTISMVMT